MSTISVREPCTVMATEILALSNLHDRSIDLMRLDGCSDSIRGQRKDFHERRSHILYIPSAKAMSRASSVDWPDAGHVFCIYLIQGTAYACLAVPVIRSIWASD